MGVEEEQSTLLPKWKRAHFSVLFDGSTQPSSAYVVNWGEKTYVDMQKEKKKAKQSPAAEVCPSAAACDKVVAAQNCSRLV